MALKAGELIERFIDGVRIEELGASEGPEIVEDAIRAELVRALRGWSAASAAVNAVRHTLEAECDAALETITPGPMGDQYLTGLGAGLSRAEQMLGHVHNALVWAAAAPPEVKP